jgi:acetyltransferase
MCAKSKAGPKSALDQGVVSGESPQKVISVFPASYVARCKLKDGSDVTIRPIRPADEPLMVKFHQTLSQDSVYFRYLGPLTLSQRTEHQRLIRVCLNGCDDELALVAESVFSPTREAEILGVGRLVKFKDSNEAEFALVVADSHQGSGLGTRLLRRLIWIARKQMRTGISGYILPDNRPMLHICEKLGFQRIHPLGDPVVKVELSLSAIAPSRPH